MQNIRFLILIFGFYQPIFAEDIYLNNSKGIVPINAISGTTLEFPRSIHEIERSSQFDIKEVVQRVEKSTRQPIDIKSIRIRPRSQKSRDQIRIRLAGGRTIFLSLQSKAGAEKNHKIHLRGPVKSKDINEISEYLEPKLKLLKTMVLDQEGGGFDRLIKDQSIYFPGLDENFDFELIRIYSGIDLYGYVIEVENDSKEVQSLDPNFFQSINGRTVVLSLLDDFELSPCGKIIPDKSIPCKTRLHLVSIVPQEFEDKESFELPFMIGAKK